MNEFLVNALMLEGQEGRSETISSINKLLSAEGTCQTNGLCKQQIMDDLEAANDSTDAAEDLYAQFNFKKALDYFNDGLELLMSIKKRTKDDKKFNKKMRKRIEEVLTRTET
jgi:hypothetical protein